MATCLGAGLYQYLESLDSVASPWIDKDTYSAPGGRSLAHDLQISLEVLMTLALGRDIVVPQSYAFDSWGFLKVATRVLRERDNAGATSERPFRLHLHNAKTLDDAVRQMLERARDPRNPFFSSLLPELRRPNLDDSELPQSFDELLASDWLGDERYNALRVINAELKDRVQPRPRRGAPRLDELLTQFASGESVVKESAQSNGGLYYEVYSELVEAIRQLDPSTLVQRSRLRLRQPWPNDQGKRLPEQLVGSRERLNLVIEFMDTVYNAVVAGSIGIAPVTFTTDISLGERAHKTREIAQELAIAAYAGRRTANTWLPGDAYDGTEGEPLFEVSIGAQEALSGHDVGSEIEKLAAHTTGEGLGALFEQRAAYGSDGSARSPFWVGIDKLRSAIESKDARATQQALEAHLKVVAGILARQGKLGWESKDLTQVAFTAGGAGGPIEATTIWHMTIPELAGLTALGAAAGFAVTKTIRSGRRMARRQSLYRALGRVVSVSELS